jgi:uncharacterized protein
MDHREVLCPICRQPSKPIRDNKAFPFCSHRCKMVDLGKWFDESYTVPAGPAPQVPDPDEF